MATQNFITQNLGCIIANSFDTSTLTTEHKSGSENELAMWRLKEGDAAEKMEAHNFLVQKHWDKTNRYFLFNFCSKDKTAAADLTQETFLRVWQYAGQWRGARFFSWFWVIASSVGIRFVNRGMYDDESANSLDDESIPEVVEPGLNAEEKLLLEERRQIIQRHLGELSEQDRTILLMENDGSSAVEISATLNIPEWRVRSALKRLRRETRVKLANLVSANTAKYSPISSRNADVSERVKEAIRAELRIHAGDISSGKMQRIIWRKYKIRISKELARRNIIAARQSPASKSLVTPKHRPLTPEQLAHRLYIVQAEITANPSLSGRQLTILLKEKYGIIQERAAIHRDLKFLRTGTGRSVKDLASVGFVLPQMEQSASEVRQ